MPKIGKNVLENLTQGMYEDSRIIYREYIQNAADQIDKALASDAFPNETLKIEIDINAKHRRIIIADNANGIPKSEVERRLADVADSEKIQGEDKGFRGIGRLGGLAYCRELRFVTSYAGESTQTTMIWDAARLEEILNDQTNHTGAEEILDQIISYRHDPCDASRHFFCIELIYIKPSNDLLLDADKVREYISEVAPLDFDERFDTLKHKIDSFLDDHNAAAAPPRDNIHLKNNHYEIFINGKKIYRPYSTFIKANTDEIKDVQTDLIRTPDGKIVAWIWFGISCFKGTMRGKNYGGLVGLRLRQFNIQIGDEHTLDKFFREQRGNGYFIGEVHAVDGGLIPNARRDYFVENEALRDFEQALQHYIEWNLDKLYRTGSELNSAFNRINKFFELRNEYDRKKLEGFTSKKEQETLELELETAKKKAVDSEKKILKIVDQAEQNDQSPLKKMVRLIQKDRNQENYRPILQVEPEYEDEPKKKTRAKLLVDELSKLKKSERKLVSLIYDIIRDNMGADISEALIRNIHAELKAQK